MDELLRRIRGDSLTPAQSQDVIIELLDLHADPAVTWSTELATLLELFWLEDRLDDAQKEAILKTAMVDTLTVEVPETVRAGAMVPVRIRHSPMRMPVQNRVVAGVGGTLPQEIFDGADTTGINGRKDLIQEPKGFIADQQPGKGNPPLLAG